MHRVTCVQPDLCNLYDILAYDMLLSSFITVSLVWVGRVSICEGSHHTNDPA